MGVITAFYYILLQGLYINFLLIPLNFIYYNYFIQKNNDFGLDRKIQIIIFISNSYFNIINFIE